MVYPPTLGALDEKHISMKKPKKSSSEYYNYKGFFSLMLIALIDTDYKFLWVDVGSSGSSSDGEIFNHSNLKKRIENGILALLAPETLGESMPEPVFTNILILRIRIFLDFFLENSKNKYFWYSLNSYS